MSRNITLAFAGAGDLAPATVNALLDDFLGFGPVDAEGFPEPSEHEITLIFPASVEHFTPALQKVLDWSERADLPYTVVLAKGDRDDSLESLVEDAHVVEEVPNVDKKMVDLLSAAEGEAYLILLWGDEGDERSEVLLDLADVAGIPAKDLTAALDDISFKDPGEEAEELAVQIAAEPEPEPVKPARGRRGARAGAKKTEETATPDEEPLAPEKAPEEPVAAPEPEVVPEPEPVAHAPSISAASPYFSGVLQSVLLHLMAQDQSNAYRNLDDPRESPLTALVREALEVATFGEDGKAQPPVEEAEEPVEEVKRGRGRPRNSEEPKVGYLVNGDGIYRKAGRGRPRRGETKVDLTADEVTDLRAKGFIDDSDD